MNVTFRKTGIEIKDAVHRHRTELQARLDKRNKALDELIANPIKVRSYLISASEPPTWMANHVSGRKGYALRSKDDISSEEKEEIRQMCERIFEIEQELNRLALLTKHLNDEQVFDLSMDDLIGYGFTAEDETP